MSEEEQKLLRIQKDFNEFVSKENNNWVWLHNLKQESGIKFNIPQWIRKIKSRFMKNRRTHNDFNLNNLKVNQNKLDRRRANKSCIVFYRNK